MCGEASGINYCIFPALLSAHGIFCLYLGRNSIRRKSPFCWIRNRYGSGVAGCRMWQKGMAGSAGRKFPVPLLLPEKDS